jgi:hypothetical protein
MDSMHISRYVAILHDGEIRVHIPDRTGNYATLCGMDGDDPDPMVDQMQVPVPPRKKIDCDDCFRLYMECKKYNLKDFVDKR